MEAYIYARYSTLEQGKGSSLARQLGDCRALCDVRGWDRCVEREIVDEGRSAFDGTNRAEGSSLAAFEQRAVGGLLDGPTVLVVERLDRLSRQSPTAVLSLVTRLTDAGVTIATVDGGRLYERGKFDFAHLIELIVKAQVAHEESEKKSHRIAAAWRRKRERAASGDKRALTRRCPEWITVDAETGEHVLIPERAAVVQRIFDLTLSGHGKHLIATILNREGEATFGRGALGWHPSYIQKILSSRAVVGDFQPHSRANGQRKSEGGPISGFYPAVVDEVTFARAQADRSARTVMRGRRTSTFNNILSGLAKCAHCGSRMTYRNKGKPGEQYLVCDSALRGTGCAKRVHFNYVALERAVVAQTLHLALDDTYFTAPDEARSLENERIKLRRELTDAKERQRRLVELLSRIENEEVIAQLAAVAALIRAMTMGLEEVERNLLIAKGAVSPLQNLERLRRFRADLISGDDTARASARGVFQQALRGLIIQLDCDPVQQQTTVRYGSSAFVVDRAGAVRGVSGPPELSVDVLLKARARGWVVTEYRDHPALGVRRS